MTVREQFSKLKENWLLILIVAALFVFVGGGNLFSNLGGASYSKMVAPEMMADSMAYGGAESRGFYPGDTGFAPEVEERVIIKTASMSNEVERGNFEMVEQRLKGIVQDSGSIILSENVNRHGEGWKGAYRGTYQVKVPLDEYAGTIAQLKELGKLTSFNENAQDITGQYISVEDQIEVEQGRLSRYQQVMLEAENVDEKLQLTDRIYDEERTIKHLQDRLENLDQRVEYTTVSINLQEKQSGYVNVALVGFSDLVESLVSSFNSLLYLVFWAFPWAIAALIVRFFWKLFKKKQ